MDFVQAFIKAKFLCTFYYCMEHLRFPIEKSLLSSHTSRFSRISHHVSPSHCPSPPVHRCLSPSSSTVTWYIFSFPPSAPPPRPLLLLTFLFLPSFVFFFLLPLPCSLPQTSKWYCSICRHTIWWYQHGVDLYRSDNGPAYIGLIPKIEFLAYQCMPYNFGSCSHISTVQPFAVLLYLLVWYIICCSQYLAAWLVLFLKTLAPMI